MLAGQRLAASEPAPEGPIRLAAASWAAEQNNIPLLDSPLLTSHHGATGRSSHADRCALSVEKLPRQNEGGPSGAYFANHDRLEIRGALAADSRSTPSYGEILTCGPHRYIHRPDRAIPVRIVGGQTYWLAALWQWEDHDQLRALDAAKAPRRAQGSKTLTPRAYPTTPSQPRGPRPLPAWKTVEGKVVEIRPGMVILERERRVVVSETVTRAERSPRSRTRNGLGVGWGTPSTESGGTAVSRQYETRTERFTVTDIPASYRVPPKGSVWRCYVHEGTSGASFPFGLPPIETTR